jgi:hypothetical protein
MLRVTLQFIIATIAYAINERMARRVSADSSTITVETLHEGWRRLFGHYGG